MATRTGATVGVTFEGKEVGVTQSAKKAEESVKHLERQSKTSSVKMIKSFVDVKAMLDVVTGAFGFVAKKIAGLARVGLEGAMNMEKNRIAFETMLGSAAKANSLLQDINKFAATTPFELPGLIVGSKRLLAFGIEQKNIIETMRNLGNAASGNQDILDRLTLAYGKMRAKGKVSLEELNMFTEAGVPILAELAKNYNTTTNSMLSMISKGTVGFSDVNNALTTLTTGTGQFAGMIEKQSQSLSGLFSTFNDNLNMLLTSLSEPVAEVLKELTKIGIDLLTEVQKWVDEHKVQITNAVRNLPEIFSIVFAMIKRIITKTFEPETFTEIFKMLGNLMLISFKTAIDTIPTLLINLFKGGGALLTIVSGNLMLALSESFADWVGSIKIFGVQLERPDPKKDKKYREIQDSITKAESELGESTAAVFDQFSKSFTKLSSEYLKTGKDLADIYADDSELIKLQKELQNILNKPLETKPETEKRAPEQQKISDDFDKYREQRLKMEQEFINKLNDLTLNRLQLLEIERKATLEEANKIGADITNIEKVFAIQRIDIMEEERAKKIEKLKRFKAEATKILKDVQKEIAKTAAKDFKENVKTAKKRREEAEERFQKQQEEKKAMETATTEAITAISSVVFDLAESFVNLIMSTELFQSVMSSLNETLVSIVEFLVVPLVEAAKPLLTILIALVSMIANMVLPVINMLGALIQQTLPFFVALGQVVVLAAKLFIILFTALAPIIEVILKVLTPILNVVSSVFAALGSIIQALNPVFEILAVVIQAVAVPVAVVAAIFEWVGNVIYNFGRFIGNMIANLFNPASWGEGMKNVDLVGMIASAVQSVTAPAADYQSMAGGELPEFNMENIFGGAGTTGFEAITPGVSGGGIFGGGVSVKQVPDINIYQYFTAPVIGEGGKATVGRYTVEAIQEFMGTGGKVTWLEA